MTVVPGETSHVRGFGKVVMDVMDERNRQDTLWGEQNHDPFTYLAILGEEVGEANKAALEAWVHTFGFLKFNRDILEKDYRTELIQVAAVAIAMVECLDRDKWNNQKETSK